MQMQNGKKPLKDECKNRAAAKRIRVTMAA